MKNDKPTCAAQMGAEAPAAPTDDERHLVRARLLRDEFELEKRLSTAAWKETLAVLTVGLAHDFNNLMAGILAPAELMLAHTGPGHPDRPMLEAIKHRSIQASELVKRIAHLHRSKPGVRGYLDFNQAVTELAELARKVLPRRVQIETTLASEQLPVHLDAVEFRQIGLGLALNAGAAMPNGGVLALGVSAHTTTRELKQHQGTFPRLPCLCLSVKDNGTGIAARHLPHLFEPFFTTKPMTEGPGLGLYSARKFVEGHGGAISVETTEGAGTTFQLWLPQADFSAI